jgi:uncharacterized protein
VTDLSGGDLFTHLLLFARQLKQAGLRITSARVTDAFRSLEHIDLAERRDFVEALQANFVSSKKEIAVFREVFGRFWARIGESTPKKTLWTDEGPEGDRDLKEGPLSAAREEAPPPAEKSGDNNFSAGYSPREAFLVKDFNQYSLEDESTLERETARLISRWTMRVSRRRKAASKGEEIDFRRTIRKAVRNGGEIVELSKRQRRIKPLKIISLCDVSGSMDASTWFTLRFIFALQRTFRRSESFVFSTRLTRITDVVKKKQRGNALQILGRRVRDWSGGTRLGACLKTFNEVWGKGMAAGSAVVILFSDGWDRGNAALLEAEMKRLKRRAHRVIWMNPLLGTPGYRPLTRGMQAALPHIDHFLPANDLKSLRRLGEVLADQLSERKK